MERAAQIAGCSAYHYQRIFSWLAGIPLAEHIRRRRLTLTAFALQRGEKGINAALRYGFEAPESFSWAFKGLHGIFLQLLAGRWLCSRPVHSLLSTFQCLFDA